MDSEWLTPTANGFIGPDGFALIHAHGLRAIVSHGQGLVMADGLVLVVFDGDGPVLLAVKVDLFRSLFVLESKLVRSPTAQGGVRFDGAFRLFTRKAVRGLVGAVIHPADDDRLIRVALQKIDDHLLADAGNVHGAPAGTGPELADPYPAGALVVALALAVPVELDLDAAVFVGVDLLAGRSGDDGGLAALDQRFGGRPQRSKRDIERDAGKIVHIGKCTLLRSRLVAAFFIGRVIHIRQDKRLIGHVAAVIVFQNKTIAAGEHAADARAGDFGNLGFLLLHSQIGQALPAAPFLVFPRIVINFEFLRCHCLLAGDLHLQIRGRCFEVEVVQRVLARRYLLMLFEDGDDVLIHPAPRSGMVEGRGLFRARLEVCRGVREDQRVFSFLCARKNNISPHLPSGGKQN